MANLSSIHGSIKSLYVTFLPLFAIYWLAVSLKKPASQKNNSKSNLYPNEREIKKFIHSDSNDADLNTAQESDCYYSCC